MKGKKVSPSLESRPRIKLSLNPLHEAYCRFIFNSHNNREYIIMSRRHDLGKLIFSHIMSGDFSCSRPVLENAVTFILPIPSNEHGYWLNYRFIYFPRWAEEKINDAIDYDFRCWVKERFRIGYEEEGMDQRTIINAILRGLNVRNNAANFDMIKKIDYRNRRKKEEIQFKRLLTLEKSVI